ncbi:hypothetical protein TNCV_4291221 [Trichonephila clavipes]|nr:hypothetical protein TNCV_4291221 [Trichonephila clavipes]
MNEDCCCKKIFLAKPSGNRPRGRPPLRWIHCVEKKSKNSKGLKLENSCQNNPKSHLPPYLVTRVCMSQPVFCAAAAVGSSIQYRVCFSVLWMPFLTDAVTGILYSPAMLWY